MTTRFCSRTTKLMCSITYSHLLKMTRTNSNTLSRSCSSHSKPVSRHAATTSVTFMTRCSSRLAIASLLSRTGMNHILWNVSLTSFWYTHNENRFYYKKSIMQHPLQIFEQTYRKTTINITFNNELLCQIVAVIKNMHKIRIYAHTGIQNKTQNYKESTQLIQTVDLI